MGTLGEVVVGLVILAGLVGVVVQILPGLFLVVRGVRKPAVVTRGYLAAIAGLVVVNVGIAVIWH